MTILSALGFSGLSAAIALAAASVLLIPRRPTPIGFGVLLGVVALVPLAATVAGGMRADLGWAAIVAGLVIAVLGREREDPLQSECALKLMWVIGSALALSWAGVELLSLTTGVTVVREQWAVLAMGVDPRFLWSTALSLALLAGLVLLGVAPFHFWVADLFQGAKPWLAPLAVAALQVTGAGWIARRLDGVHEFPEAAWLTGALLGFGALIGLVAGALTLVFQRRPERRVGTLASLNGASMLAILAAVHGAGEMRGETPGIEAWAAHLVLALTGAATLGRFIPVAGVYPDTAPVLIRRHPWTGLIGLYAMFSLAGVPGTPGAGLWLDTAQTLARAGRADILIALVIAWLIAFSVCIRQFREVFGRRSKSAPPDASVPWQSRTALWIGGATLLITAVAGVVG